MKIIGLTGPSGAGKSTLATLATARGWAVIDCDRTAHAVYAEDKILCIQLAEAFGQDILNSAGQIDRKRLALRAFSSKEATMRLNRVALPRIVMRIEQQISNCSAQFCLLDAPTLYESGLSTRCDSVIAVLASERKRQSRIMTRDSLTLEEVALRLSAGKPDKFYRQRADYILENDGSAEAFIQQASRLLETIEKE